MSHTTTARRGGATAVQNAAMASRSQRFKQLKVHGRASKRLQWGLVSTPPSGPDLEPSYAWVRAVDSRLISRHMYTHTHTCTLSHTPFESTIDAVGKPYQLLAHVSAGQQQLKHAQRFYNIEEHALAGGRVFVRKRLDMLNNAFLERFTFTCIHLAPAPFALHGTARYAAKYTHAI
eukprot:4343462-Pleurochrysis_carterae.AAC.4